MSWSPLQRTVLAELDIALYRVAGAQAAVPMQAAAALAEADNAMLVVLAQALGMPLEVLQQDADVVAASGGLRGHAAAKRALWPRLRALKHTQQ